MQSLNTSSSLPLFKKKSQSSSTQKHERYLQRANRSVMKRLYAHDVKKIRLRENSYWHKSRADTSLEKSIKKLRIKSKNNRPRLPCISFTAYYGKTESAEALKLKKLQDTMRQIVIFPYSANHDEMIKNSDDTYKRNARLSTDLSIIEERYEVKNPLDIKATAKTLEEYKESLDFVNTRIKVIMTSLPALRQKLDLAESQKMKKPNISQKLQKMMDLLNLYQSSKEKLINLIEAYHTTLEHEKRIQEFYHVRGKSGMSQKLL